MVSAECNAVVGVDKRRQPKQSKVLQKMRQFRIVLFFSRVEGRLTVEICVAHNSKNSRHHIHTNSSFPQEQLVGWYPNVCTVSTISPLASSPSSFIHQRLSFLLPILALLILFYLEDIQPAQEEENMMLFRHHHGRITSLARRLLPRRCFSSSQNKAAISTATTEQQQDLPTHADVVVVGGGSIGASILYHLQEKGQVNAVLLERHELTAGTTWHSAGMLWRLRPSYIDIELHTYSRHLCVALEQETGITSWTENGGLFIAGNRQRMAEYQRLAETGIYYDIPSQLLAPQDILHVHPLLNVDDVYGGLYSPTDGTMDPNGIVRAYARAARTRGGKIFEHTGVADILTETIHTTPTVTGVVTDSGHVIHTSMVVNAAGAWAPSLAAMVGQKIPLLAMKHAFVVTEAIQGMHGGLPNVRDHDLSIYLKAQGNALALGGYEQNPEFWDTVSPNFAFGLFDLDWETFGQNLEGHLQRCPVIETTGITSTVAGPESFTPDHKPLVGPQPGVQGFFNACGFNSMGMMLGGGIGREAATWILQGSPSMDLFSFDCARFHPDSVRHDTWVRDRTHESYAKTYAIVFPHDEPLAGRGNRKSALHDELQARGCVHQARHGFERPGWFVEANSSTSQAPKPYDFYGAYQEGAWRLAPSLRDSDNEPANIAAHQDHLYLDLIKQELKFDWPQNYQAVAEECQAARHGVALFDQSYFGKFFLEGPDAMAAVQYICGADMDKQVPGTITYTPLCNPRGGVEADLTVTCLPNGGSGYYIAAGGNTATKDFEWIRRQLENHGFTAKLVDRSDEICMLSVQGPHSRALLSPLVTQGSLENQDFSTSQEIVLAGVKMLCLRLTFVGELGFELHIPSKNAAAVYRAVRAAGVEYEKAHGVPVRDAGYRAIDSLSAEMNYRHWHADLSNAETPFEANIGFTVLGKLKREDSPAFIGRDALQQQRASGLQKKLVCLTITNPDQPLFGMETIWRNGTCLGLVRSTAYGYTIGANIAYGYVHAPPDVPKITKKWLEAGEWEIGDKMRRIPAVLHLRAPYDPMVNAVTVA